MKKQTAVEWLVKIYLQTNKIDSFDIEQAKAMEKEQVVDAYDAGLFDGTMDDVKDRIHNNYYNETFGGEQ